MKANTVVVAVVTTFMLFAVVYVLYLLIAG
jgi:hypothetical protein